MGEGAAAWRRWQASASFDVVFALVMLALTVLGSLGESHPSQAGDRLPGGHAAPAGAYLLVAFAALVLIWRRRWPVPVLVAALAGVLTYTCLGYVDGAALLAPMAALYAVTVTVRMRDAVLWTLFTTVTLMAANYVFDPLGRIGGGFDLLPVMGAAVLFLGLAVANRRAYLAELEHRAELAERSREEEALRRVDAERLRIARELHDVVAHTMATINVQAGVAAHVIAEHPDKAAAALVEIKAASKHGLRELRAILDVLRQVDDQPSIQPAQGLARLDALLATTGRAGLNTTLQISGVTRPLPAAVDLAAYRIVQESLTNAIRYAAPATALVTVNQDDGQLAIDVTDTGPGSAAVPLTDSGGHGLVGMRERAMALGGTFDAHPGPHGGFHVHACLPVRFPT